MVENVLEVHFERGTLFLESDDFLGLGPRVAHDNCRDGITLPICSIHPSHLGPQPNMIHHLGHDSEILVRILPDGCKNSFDCCRDCARRWCVESLAVVFDDQGVDAVLSSVLVKVRIGSNPRNYNLDLAFKYVSVNSTALMSDVPLVCPP